MYSTIRTAHNIAILDIAFPKSPFNIEYLIYLAIRANKVEYIVIELFRVHIETEDRFRYIVLGNRVRYIPEQEISL